MKYFTQNHIHVKELNAILSSISTLSTSNDVITHELLYFILLSLDSPLTTIETTNGLLSDPNTVEELYSLLIVNNLSCETKEILLKIMKYFIGSNRVSQLVRAQLRLETNHIGFGGIISGMSRDELNLSIVQDILHLITSSSMFIISTEITKHLFCISDSLIAVHHLNVVLTLCSAASLDVRYIAMRRVRRKIFCFFIISRFYLAYDIFYFSFISMSCICQMLWMARDISELFCENTTS
jgi:hypothetical protein